MHPGVQVRYEAARGCGRRKAGGLYLTGGGGPAWGCGMFPIRIPDVCPTCGEGVRPSRAPRWLEEPDRLWVGHTCRQAASGRCARCPLGLGELAGPVLLLWVGEKFYPSPQDFLEEARRQGFSRRIPAVPSGFVVGQTWVMLAHRRAFGVYASGHSTPVGYRSGIIAAYRPEALEVVVTEAAPDSEVEGYLKRGITPVIVRPANGRKDVTPAGLASSGDSSS